MCVASEGFYPSLALLFFLHNLGGQIGMRLVDYAVDEDVVVLPQNYVASAGDICFSAG